MLELTHEPAVLRYAAAKARPNGDTVHAAQASEAQLDRIERS